MIESPIETFELASRAIKAAPGGKPGQGAENNYGAAYQALVRAGIAPQIRKKYR